VTFKKGIMNFGKPTPFLPAPGLRRGVGKAQGRQEREVSLPHRHACSSNALLSAVMEKTGESYWDAMRGLEEAAMLLEKTGKSLMQVRRTRGRYF
jgi:two-component system chemotaxis response regulator CheB